MGTAAKMANTMSDSGNEHKGRIVSPENPIQAWSTKRPMECFLVSRKNTQQTHQNHLRRPKLEVHNKQEV